MSVAVGGLLQLNGLAGMASSGASADGEGGSPGLFKSMFDDIEQSGEDGNGLPQLKSASGVKVANLPLEGEQVATDGDDPLALLRGLGLFGEGSLLQQVMAGSEGDVELDLAFSGEVDGSIDDTLVAGLSLEEGSQLFFSEVLSVNTPALEGELAALSPEALEFIQTLQLPLTEESLLQAEELGIDWQALGVEFDSEGMPSLGAELLTQLSPELVQWLNSTQQLASATDSEGDIDGDLLAASNGRRTADGWVSDGGFARQAPGLTQAPSDAARGGQSSSGAQSFAGSTQSVLAEGELRGSDDGDNSLVEGDVRRSDSLLRSFASLTDGPAVDSAQQAPSYGANGALMRGVAAGAVINAASGQGVMLNDPSMADKLVERVSLFMAQNLKTADIRVDPPDMGPIQVKIHHSNDQTSISFTSHNAQVREALDQNLAKLRDMFAQQGMDILNVDVSGGDAEQSMAGAHDQGADGEHDGGYDLDDEEIMAEADDAVMQAVVSPSLVDTHA